MSSGSNSFIARAIRSATQIEEREMTAVLLSFLFVFVLMTAYSILKPIRDALAADWGSVGLSVTWTINFVLSAVAVSAYGAALSFVRFRIIVPAVYAFFALTFVTLYIVTEKVPDPVLINKGFYVWVSVFSLFHLSVFWSFMSDLFNKSQAPRVFGFIAAGTSVGAIAGPLITTTLVDSIGTNSLMLVSAVMLLIPIPIILVLEKLKLTHLNNAGVQADLSAQQKIGKNPFAGFTLLFKSEYLLAIGAFILLYVTINTFVYFELQDLTQHYEINTRTKIWSWIDLATNGLTLLTAAFVTNRVVTRFGMATALAMMPALVFFGILVLVATPALLALAIFQIARRVGNYAVTRPSREMLFTVVDRETRFKAKPVIDIVLYRGGDMLTAWVFTFFAKGLGFGLVGIAIVISGIAAAWFAVAAYLGRLYVGRTVESIPSR